MADNETRVTYRAVADWTAFNRAIDRAKKKLQELRSEEALTNASSIAGSDKAADATRGRVNALQAEKLAVDQLAKSMDRAQAATGRHSATQSQGASNTRSASNATRDLASGMERTTGATNRTSGAIERMSRSGGRLIPVLRSSNRELRASQKAADQATGGTTKLLRNLDRLRDWRPRLLPPFIALIPVIAGLLGLVNPLVAGFGSLVPVALGFASSLGSVAASAIGAIPALATLLGTVLSLKTAFAGIGGAFQKYGAMKAASGGGGGGGGGGGAPAAVDKPAEISKTERIARANEDYRRALEDVKFAEEDLTDTRKDYIKRLNDLQKAVDRAAQSEARAAANRRLAQENYANVLADPGSTKGQKMDAAAGIAEANSELADVRAENKQNAADLTEMQRKGINGDRQVIESQRAVTDAMDAVRDAQIALKNSYRDTDAAATAAAGGGGGGGGGGIDAFQQALDRLSPSAKSFVLQIIAMEDEFDKMRRTVQESFFSEFIDDIQLLYRLFPPVTSMMSNLAGAAGRVVSNLLKMVTSDAWLADIALFGEEAAPVVEDVGNGLLFLADALRNVVMAAMPFLKSMSGRFQQSMKDFQNLLSSSRKDGSLAAYLQKVEGRLLQWWSIIKNVGATLFNYSAAASDFGQWLTDGLQKMTEGWVENSEDARKEGSGFKKYLETLKKPLKEVKALFGDFFGYLHSEATDPETIEMFTELVRSIREDVGPALKTILDALSDSGIQNTLVDALSAVLTTIGTFLDNGGAEGLKSFFEVMTDIFNVVGDIVERIPEPVVKGFVSAFAVLAALTFVGLNALIGNLITLGATKGLLGILDKVGKVFPGLSGSKDPKHVAGTGGRHEAGRGGGTVVGGSSRGGKGAARADGVAGADGEGGTTGVVGGSSEKKPRGRRSTAVPVPSKHSAKPKGVKPKGAGLKGGIAALIGGLVIDAVAGEVSASAPAGKAGSGTRVGANIADGAATGALTGATIGSIVPGVGTAVGAVAGTAVGATAGILNSDQSDIDAFNEQTNGMFEDFFSNTLGMFKDFFTINLPSWWKTDVLGAFDQMKENFTNNWNESIEGIKEGWSTYVEEPFNTAVNAFKVGWALYVEQPFNLAVDTFKAGWNKYVEQPFNLAVAAFQLGWNKYVETPFNTAVAAFKAGWSKYVEVPFNNAVSAFKAGWEKYVTTPLNNTNNLIRANWEKYVTTPFNNAVALIKSNWDKYVVEPFKSVSGTVKANWETYVTTPFNLAIAAIKSMWQVSVVDPFNRVIDFIRSVFNIDLGGIVKGAVKAGAAAGGAAGAVAAAQKQNNGGPILKRARGGNVPGEVGGHGNSDTVPAMLTPGEYVIRKSIVNRIGLENLSKLNSGVLSFAQMLRQSSATSTNGGVGADGLSFFNAGGLVPSLSSNSSSKMSASVGTNPAAAFGNDYSVHTGDIHIHNPVPERASESLPSAIRKVGYLGAVRNEKN